MKGRIFYFYLFFCLCFVGNSIHSLAQSITTNALSASIACFGSETKLSVPFSTTGIYKAGNVFTAQISDANGIFSGATTSIGALTLTPSVSTTTTISATIPKTLAGGAGYKIRVISSNPALTNANLQPLNILAVGSPSIPTTPSYCEGDVAKALVATPSTGGVLQWYGTNPSSTSTSTATVPDTKVIGSNPYYVGQSVSGCTGPNAIIYVVVNGKPNAPTTSTKLYCVGDVASPLSASAVAGATLNWYTGPTSASIPSAPIPSTARAGSTAYYVSQSLNGCESPRASVTVTIKPAPNAPSVTNLDFCQNAAVPTLTASFSANATANWYGTNPTGGTPSGTPPLLQSTTPGPATYYVSQTLDGCQSPRASLLVNVKAIPPSPGVNSVNYCNNVTAQPLTATGSSIKWYDASDNPLTGTPTPATNSIGNQQFKATQTVNGCESGKATLIVTVKSLPASPGVTNLAYCQAQQDQSAQTVAQLTANGQNLRWYNPDGNSFPNAPTPNISQAGTATYQVSQTIDGCESVKATLQVVVNTLAVPTVTKSLLSYCINEKAVPLQATGATGSTLKWVDPYGRITNDPPTPATTNTNVAPGGDAFYVYQVGSSGCVSGRATIKVIVNTIPTLSLTGSANINLGQKTPLRLKFTGNPPFSYTLTGGYSGVSNTTDTIISVLPRGNTTYQVALVSNSCGMGLPGDPATAVVTVLVPTITTSSLNSTTLCAGAFLSVPFTTTGPFTNGNVFQTELISVADTTKKYTVSTGTNASPVAANLPNILAGGQYYVRVKASNPDIGIVGSTSPTVITVRSKPTAILTGTQTIYEGTPANLTIAFGGDGPWALAYADSSRSFAITTNANPYTFEVRPARTTTYQITNLSNNCGSGSGSGTATVSVQIALGVEDTSLEPLVNVYPVPTGSTLTVAIDLALNREPAVISLTDQRGRLVRQQKTRALQTELNLSDQPAGLYLLRIQVGDRQTIRKVLKQ